MDYRLLWSLMVICAAILAVNSKKVAVGSGCDSGSDCGGKQCCVSNTRRRGKRDVDMPPRFEGTCQWLIRKNKNCYVGANAADKDDVVEFPSCPCRGRRNTCVGNGFMEPPYGETGTCKRQKKRN